MGATGAVLADGLCALEAALAGGVYFGSGDHFAVGGGEVEFDAGRHVFDFKLSHDGTRSFRGGAA